MTGHVNTCRKTRSAARGPLVLLIGLILSGLCSMPAMAVETALHFVEPRIGKDHFALLGQGLDLAPDQRIIMEALYRDYADSIDQLINQTDALADGVGRQRVNDALSGKTLVPPAELRALRVEVLKTYELSWPETDRLLEQLLDDTRSILNSEQIAQFDTSLREIRRMILLHPRQAEALYPEYAGDGVDVLLLAAQATASRGELESIDRSQLNEILDAYEYQLDALLIDTAKAHRKCKLEARIARLQRDPEAIAAQEQIAVGLWQQLYQLNRHTVTQIGDLAGDMLGADARNRWLNRFDRESFAWLFAPRTPDRQYDWLKTRRMDAQLKADVESIYKQYRTRRSELIGQAIEIMLRGRLEYQTMLYSMMDPTSVSDAVRRGLYQELLINSGELAGLESNTSSELEALLTDDQRQQMRKGIRGR